MSLGILFSPPKGMESPAINEGGIARTPKEIESLVGGRKGGGERTRGETKRAAVKKVSFRIPTPMEALKEIGTYPRLDEETYLEKKGEGEEDDFYILRKSFADLVEDSLGTNRITSLVLGEAFAKKVRYGVTYSPEIEDVITLMRREIKKEK